MDVAANLAVTGVCTAALIQWGAPRSAYSILVPLFLLCLVGTKVARIVLRPYYSKLRQLPGPKDDQFLVGQALRLLRAPGPNDLYIEWTRKWPDAPFIRHLSWGNSETLVINSIDACRQVLQTHAYSFVKPAYFSKLVSEFLGSGLLFSVGDQHRRLRRIIAGPLSVSQIRKLLPAIREKARALSANLENLIHGEAKGIVEFSELLNSTALDVICELLFGESLGTFKSSSSSLTFKDCYERILTPGPLGLLLQALNPVFPLRWIPVRANRRFNEANRVLTQMIRELIQRRKRERKARQAGGTSPSDSGAKGENMLNYLLDACETEKGGMSDTELLECLLQFVSAGHATTAESLAFTIWALGNDPPLQKRLREEVQDAPGNVDELDVTAIDSLHLLNNIVRESLRVYNPTLVSPWETGQDLLLAGVHVPKGTTVTTSPTALHMNPRIWGPDAAEFRPDRWDALTGEAASIYAFESFLNGPRTCPGRALALLEIKVVLMEFVTSFEFRSLKTELAFQNPSLVLRAKGGVEVEVRRLLQTEAF